MAINILNPNRHNFMFIFTICLNNILYKYIVYKLLQINNMPTYYVMADIYPR